MNTERKHHFLRRSNLIIMLTILYLLFLRNTNAQESLSGNYSIGTSGDYQSITAAVSSLTNNGISNNVTFNIEDGIYNEQFIIPQISGSSSTNTITFQSSSKDNSKVTITYNSENSDTNYIIMLDGADFITINNISISSSGSYGRLIHINNQSCNNNFINNIFTGKTNNSSSNNNAIIYSDDHLDSNNIFKNNIFNNGSYGIYLYGKSTSKLEYGLQIENNTFNNQYYKAMHLYYQNAPIINKNTIASSSPYSYYYGIYACYADNNLTITNNQISRIESDGIYGIYIKNCDAKIENKGLIANNFIQMNGNGIYLYSCKHLNVYYNSLNITSTDSSDYAIRIKSGAYNSNIINNIFANSGGGYAIYCSSTSETNYIDYNNLFSSGNYISYFSDSNYVSLYDWQLASNQDSNSISIEPQYNSSIDLHTKNLSINGKGTPLTNVITDIDGDLRDSLTPDIGADEFSPSIITKNTHVSKTNDIIQIYPNPSSGTFNIDIKGNVNEQYDLKIFNIEGKKILSQNQIKSNTNNINLEKFQKGIYFIHLISKSGILRKKIILQ